MKWIGHRNPSAGGSLVPGSLTSRGIGLPDLRRLWFFLGCRSGAFSPGAGRDGSATKKSGWWV